MDKHTLKSIRDRYEANGFQVFPHDPNRPKGYLDSENYPAPDRWFTGKSGLAIAAINGLLGIDVDAYEGTAKVGDQTLARMVEEAGEKLPDTYTSTARGADQPSRIYWFRVPADVKFISKEVSIETIQATHRYGKVYPSVNPKVNAVYRWYTPNGDLMPEDEVPVFADLPELPAAWVERLRKPERTSSKSGVLDYNDDQLLSRMMTDGDPCFDVRGALDTYRQITRDGESHYDSARDAAWNILHLGDEGHTGTRAALDTLRAEYVEYVSGCGDRDRDGDAEFDRFIESAPGNMEYFTDDDERIGCGGMLGCGRNPNPELMNTTPLDPELEILRDGDGNIPATWAPVDLSFLHLNDWEDKTPLIGSLGLGDDRGLFYVGKTNTLVGDPEAGKSWIAQKVVQETLSAGGTVLYLDHESDVRAVCTRLALLGSSVADMTSGRFVYVNPAVGNRKLSEIDAWKRHLTAGYDLVIIDGVTAAVAITGGSTNSQDDVAKWWNEVPKPLEFTGACVITIDHTTKAGTERRGALGSIIKVALVSGISYMLIAESPLAPGMVGSSKLRIDKDRPGRVARHAWLESSARMVGSVTVDSTEGKPMQIYIDDAVPVHRSEKARSDRREKIIEALTGSDGMSKNAIGEIVRGRRAEVIRLVETMVEDGELEVSDRAAVGGGSLYKLPARESADQVSGSGPCLIGTGTREPLPRGSNLSGSGGSEWFPEPLSNECTVCGEPMECDADGEWFCVDFCDESEAA